jgi:hypothetical protein
MLNFYDYYIMQNYLTVSNISITIYIVTVKKEDDNFCVTSYIDMKAKKQYRFLRH